MAVQVHSREDSAEAPLGSCQSFGVRGLAGEGDFRSVYGSKAWRGGLSEGLGRRGLKIGREG